MGFTLFGYVARDYATSVFGLLPAAALISVSAALSTFASIDRKKLAKRAWGLSSLSTIMILSGVLAVGSENNVVIKDA